jgi:hypothetical protein
LASLIWINAPICDRVVDFFRAFLSLLGMPMQNVNLTDDELWRAIAENTNAMAALVREQCELDAGIGRLSDSDSRWLIKLNAQTIGILQSEYQDYAAELCRRYRSMRE